MPSIRKFGAEFFWVVLGQSLGAIGSLVGVRLLTQVLSPENYGEFALVLTLVNIGTQLVMGPLANSVLRFYAPASEARQLYPYLVTIRRMAGLATLGLTGLTVMASLVLWAIGSACWAELVWWALLFALFSGVNALLDSLQNAARQRRIVAWHQASGQWLRPLLALGAIGCLSATTGPVMLGSTLAIALVLCSQWFFLHRGILRHASEQHAGTPSSLEEPWSGKLFRYAWPFALWGIFSCAQQASDRWALEGFRNSAEVGQYAALYQIGYAPLILLSGMIVQLVTPILCKMAGDGRDRARLAAARRQIVILTSLALAAAFVLAGAMWVVEAPVTSVLLAAKFREGSECLPLFVLAAGLFNAAQIYCLTFMIGVETQDLILPKIVSCCLGVMFSIVGAQLYGTRGVVAGLIAFSVSFLVLLFLQAWRKGRRTQAPIAVSAAAMGRHSIEV